MPTAPWMTDDILKRLTELATQGMGNTPIAHTLSAEFKIFIGTNMVAGKIHKLGISRIDRHTPYGPRKTALDAMTGLHDGPKPAFGTPAGIAVMLKAREKRIPQRVMLEYFGIAETPLRCLFRRLDRKVRPEAAVEIDPMAKFVTKLWPREKIKKMISLRMAAELTVDIGKKIGASQQSVAAKIRQLTRADLLPPFDRVACAEARKTARLPYVAPVAPPAPVIAVIAPKPATHVSGRASGLHFGSLSGMNLYAIKAPSRGRCSWPLACSNPTDGTICVKHARMVRRAA